MATLAVRESYASRKNFAALHRKKVVAPYPFFVLIKIIIIYQQVYIGISTLSNRLIAAFASNWCATKYEVMGSIIFVQSYFMSLFF